MKQDLPDFRVIESALRKTTERLTRELAAPRNEAPDWNELEWRVARAAAAIHGISALLANRLVWQGPPAWCAFLHEQRRQSLARHTLIGERLATLNAAGQRAGLAYMPLKGAALRDFNVHHPGERPMGDIDVLVRPADAARAAQVFDSLGYEPAYSARRHDVFIPRERTAPHAYAEHVSSPLRIELHVRISEALPVAFVDITDSLWSHDSRPGANAYASFAALLRHLCLHTAGNMRANCMRFIQVYDCALLSRRMGESDWRALLGADPRLTAWWIYPVMSLVERYVPDSVPSAVLEEIAGVCPRRLRERFRSREVTDVSWSNLRIAALPGLEWARSFREGIRLARKRAFPTREDIDELHRGLHTNPACDQSRWYRGSHAARILRWTFGRPPRVQTMASIRAVLAE